MKKGKRAFVEVLILCTCIFFICTLAKSSQAMEGQDYLDNSLKDEKQKVSQLISRVDGFLEKYGELTSSSTWTQTAQGPLDLYGHTMGAIGDKLYIFGGYGGSDVRSNNLYEYSVDSGINIISTSTWKPDLRAFHASAVADNNNREGKALYIFGGEYPYKNDLWKFNPETNAWTEKNLWSDHNRPPSLDYASMCSVGQDLYLTGGEYYTGGFGVLRNYNTDLYKYEAMKDAWQRVQVAGDVPYGWRLGSTLVNINNKLYLFGGLDVQKDKTLNGLWVFDLASNSWTELAPSGKPPLPRFRHSAVVHDGKMYIMGGASGVDYWENAQNALNDTWEYDPIANSWQQLNSNGPALFYHASASMGNSIYTYGGKNSIVYGSGSKKLWEYTFPSDCIIKGSSTDRIVKMASGNQIVDAGDNCWTITLSTGTVKPDVSLNDLIIEGLPVGLSASVVKRTGNTIELTVSGNTTTPLTIPQTVTVLVKSSAVDESGLQNSEPIILYLLIPNGYNTRCKSEYLVNQNVYYLDGTLYNMEMPAVDWQGYIFAKAKYVEKALGIDDNNVFWDDANNRLTLIKGDTVFQLYPLDGTAKVNGVPVTLDAASNAPFSLNGFLVLPIADLAKIFNYNVVSLDNGNRIQIFDNEIPNDTEAVSLDKAALAITFAAGDSASSVTQNITLPTSGANGTTISWSSDNAAVSNTGVVTRPSYVQGDVVVTLTATISNTCSDTKQFGLTVKAQPSTPGSGTIAGQASPDGLAPDHLDIVTIEALDSSGNIVSSCLSGSDGSFSLANLPQGTYTVKFNAKKYLVKKVTGVGVIADGRTVNIPTVVLRVGDTDGDNKVDLGDLIALAKSYNKTQGQMDYNDNCDFNGDKTINLLDLSILGKSYSLAGDN